MGFNFNDEIILNNESIYYISYNNGPDCTLLHIPYKNSGLFCNGNRLCVKLQTGDGVDVDKMFNNFIIIDFGTSYKIYNIKNVCF